VLVTYKLSTRNNWDRKFILKAHFNAQFSKDPSTKVGSCIVGPDFEPISDGYNDFPRKVQDDIQSRRVRPENIVQIGSITKGATRFYSPVLPSQIPSEDAAVSAKKVTQFLPSAAPAHARIHSVRLLSIRSVAFKNDSPHVMAAKNRPQPLGDVLQEVIAQLGLQEKIDEARVVETWAALAGTKINSVTESVWLKGSTLYVKITSAAWRQELHMNRRKWRERLNGQFETDLIEEIVFR